MISRLYEERLKKDLSRLAILTLITVVAWIAVSVYKALNKSQLTPDVKKQILPLTASIDLDTMELIKNRVVIAEADWPSLGLLPPESPELVESQQVEQSEATSSAITQPEEPEATASGSVEL